MITLLVGMIASGKSTYASEQAKLGALVVSHDALTEMLHAEYRYESILRYTYRAMEEALVQLALAAGRPVIIDRTHLTRESRERWTKFASQVPCPIRAVVFQFESAWTHAKRRSITGDRGRRPEEWLKVAEHHAEQWAAEPLDNWQAEGFSEAPTFTGEI